MNSKVLNALSFVAGGVIGSIATYFLVNNKLKKEYEKRANDDINQMREYYNEQINKEIPEKEQVAEEEKGEELFNPKELKEKVDEFGYSGEEEEMYTPEIIAPEESWERDYPTISLTFYEGDGILSDDRGKIIKNAKELVGDDFTNHFGEYEEDCVYVLNEKHKVYYEILRDTGSYSEDHE